MSDDRPAPDAPPPHAQLVQMGTAYWVSRILYAAATLNIADHLVSGPKRAEDLAGPTGTHAPSLYRLLRALAGLGLLTEDAQRRFATTPLGKALETGAHGSARATILTLGGEVFTRTWENLPYSLQTGKSGAVHAIGMSIFDWLAQHPEEASLFSETMIGIHGEEPAAIAAAYDFSGAGTIVDVGGATGHLLATILAAHSGPKGILFDLPHVVRDAPVLIASRGLTDRITIVPGSFFESVPSGGDVYMLSHIIHDWTEELCLKILGHCRRAMNPGGRICVIEMVIPPGNDPHPGKILDIMMLVGPEGQERTEQEYRELFEKAGLRLTRVVPTASPASIVEAVAAA